MSATFFNKRRRESLQRQIEAAETFRTDVAEPEPGEPAEPDTTDNISRNTPDPEPEETEKAPVEESGTESRESDGTPPVKRTGRRKSGEEKDGDASA